MAAFYPTLSFSAAAALEGNSLLNWFTWPSRVWSVGPAIAQTLFEAGGRKAVKAEADASYDALAATYRQTVLTALQGVEDNLSTLRILEQEERQQLQAVDSAAMTTQLSMNQYRGGVTNYLQVITAQALELSNRITLSNIETRRMVAAVLLVQNLGGGWSATSLPQPQQLLPTHRPGWRGKMFPDSPPDLAPAAPNPPAAAKP
jgi:outer membrane protein TolC